MTGAYGLREFTALVETKFQQARRADVLDAPFPYDAEQAKIWHAGRASVLNWVIEMLPPVISVADHYARVDELLASNNALLERAREAEAALSSVLSSLVECAAEDRVRP